MTRESKLAMILCGLLGGLWAAGPTRTAAHALSASTQSSPLPGESSVQTPAEQVAPTYPQTEDGFNAQIAAAVAAYGKGDAAAGRRLLEQFRMSQSDQWFALNFGPEQSETLAKRYDRLF